MIKREIINNKTGDKLIGFINGDIEFVNPIKFYEESFILEHMILKGIPDEEICGEVELSEKNKNIFIEAGINFKRLIQEIKTEGVPENFIKLLETNKKATQEYLLKGAILTPKILMGLIITAEKTGYTLSEYTGEHFPKNVDLSKMPQAYRVKKNGEVEIFGKTELTNGQLRQALEQRKVTIAKFLDKGEEWHCFFLTFNSLKGKETWLGEKQPHYHYISNAFELSLEYVVKQIKSKKYNLGSLPHIKLENYGNQPIKLDK